MKTLFKLLLSLLLSSSYLIAHAGIQAEASTTVKIALAKKPTSKPMSIAYYPLYQKYYVADGGLAPLPGENEAPLSRSEIHVYGDDGKYLKSARPGYDNRVIYFNDTSKKLETITFNISTAAGFSPNTGIFSLDLDNDGFLTGKSDDVFGFNPAFGDASTMPSYDPDHQVYYAKQGRSNAVWVIKLPNREKSKEILLDLKAAGAQFDDVADYFVAYTGVTGNELAILDVDHKAVLLFNLEGKFAGKSMLPANMKLRAQNHIAGMAYSNGIFFVLHEPEGEFGTFYGFKIFTE
ncbi:MAG: hypothetical protein FGM31_00120 [Candidatus Methylopumilus sp.]|jgi:hypothetical protein|nr:hypothetical protein [Candidatus Methylopumilus sp.]NBW61226.1 hypothetical protein [Methylophilaceae bacterium]